MDRSVRMLAAVTALLAAVFLIMGRIITNAPLEDWGLPVLVFAVGVILLLWFFYSGRPRTPARPFDDDDAALPAQADSERLSAGPREFRSQRDTAIVGVPPVPAVPALEAAPVIGMTDTGASVRAFVSDPAVQVREDTPTPTIAEIDAASPADTEAAPEFVGEVTADTPAHADAVTTDASAPPQPFSAGTVTAAHPTEVPHTTESGPRENTTREHPPLSAIPADPSIEATDKSQPANAPDTVTVLEANNARQTTPEMAGATPISTAAAEAVVPAVQQASQANADAGQPDAVKPVVAEGTTTAADSANTQVVAENEALVNTGETRGEGTRGEGVGAAGADAGPGGNPGIAEVAASPTLDLSKSPTEKRDRDNLEVIEGIGPKIAGTLHAAGISTFERLASTPEAEIRSILSAATVRIIGSVSASIPTWAEQASMAARGDLAGLRAWQNQYKAGR